VKDLQFCYSSINKLISKIFISENSDIGHEEKVQSEGLFDRNFIKSSDKYLMITKGGNSEG
jgi:hypothetical protein